jgi:hypothetical protein
MTITPFSHPESVTFNGMVFSKEGEPDLERSWLSSQTYRNGETRLIQDWSNYSGISWTVICDSWSQAIGGETPEEAFTNSLEFFSERESFFCGELEKVTQTLARTRSVQAEILRCTRSGT